MRFALLALLLATMAAAEPPTQWERLHGGSVTPMQATPLPSPEARGEYTRQKIKYHPFWEVVAKGGLNGRRGKPEGAGPHDFAQMPVVNFFREGAILTAYAGKDTQTGWCFWPDKEGKYWLRVLSNEKDDPEATCFVRLNSKFLRPVRVSEK